MWANRKSPQLRKAVKIQMCTCLSMHMWSVPCFGPAQSPRGMSEGTAWQENGIRETDSPRKQVCRLKRLAYLLAREIIVVVLEYLISLFPPPLVSDSDSEPLEWPLISPVVLQKSRLLRLCGYSLLAPFAKVRILSKHLYVSCTTCIVISNVAHRPCCSGSLREELRRSLDDKARGATRR